MENLFYVKAIGVPHNLYWLLCNLEIYKICFMTPLIRTSILCFIILFSLPGDLFSNHEFDEEVVKVRIDSLRSQVVNPRYDNIVRSYLKTYTIFNREKSERILGRRLIYFPVFEAYLAAKGLPDDLKYLPIVESALEARAVSSAGAVGLWQFMPETGRYYGLEITNQVDERCDPYRSTEAAMDYLSVLYDRFQDWELAIAAYNSGGGRVSRAIKRARSKNFWKVKRYLPRETANYVPAFIAASYLLKHYEEHELNPNTPSLDAQLNEQILIEQPFSFYDIAQISGATLDLIEFLNPAYSQGFIPASPYKKRRLNLPKRNMMQFRAYLETEKSESDKQSAFATAPVFIAQSDQGVQEAYQEDFFLLRAGESIVALAQRLEIPVVQLMAWNKLEGQVFEKDVKLKVYRPKPPAPNPLNTAVQAMPPLQDSNPAEQDPPQVVFEESIYEKDLDRFLFQKEFVFYWNPRKQRISNIADQLPGISVDDIMELNGYEKDKMIRKNNKIIIKKLGR